MTKYILIDIVYITNMNYSWIYIIMHAIPYSWRPVENCFVTNEYFLWPRFILLISEYKQWKKQPCFDKYSQVEFVLVTLCI